MAELYSARRFANPKGNIRIDLKEIGISESNYVDSVQDRDYSETLMNAASISNVVS